MNNVADESVDTPSTAKNGTENIVYDKPTKALRLELHTLLKQVDYDYQRMQYNTVVSGAMKLLNALEDFTPTLGTGVSSLPPEGALAARGGPSPRDFKSDNAAANAAVLEGFGILLRCLYPAAPHICHALWQNLGFAATLGDLLDAPWPQVDASALQQDEIELMLQVSGKLRGSIVVPAGASKEAIEQIAVSCDIVTKLAAGAAVKKVIVVPGRLVNVVL